MFVPSTLEINRKKGTVWSGEINHKELESRKKGKSQRHAEPSVPSESAFGQTQKEFCAEPAAVEERTRVARLN
jgi:hypothetical protein